MKLRKLSKLLLGCGLAFALCSTQAQESKPAEQRGGQSDVQGKQIEVSESTFKCLSEMTPVRGFFVANLLGKLDDTVKVASSPTGGRYPPGSVVQLVPSEVMVKHHEGWNSATNDWEFFELNVSPEGSKIKVRGVTEVVNRFGGNCFACHVRAKPEWDLICEKDHGCAPLPVTTAQITAIQKADPRCKKE